MIFSAKIVGRTFKIDREAFIREIERMPDGDYTLTLIKTAPSKSPAQMAYYRGVCLPTLAKEIGYEEQELDQLHREVKHTFKIESLKDLDKTQFQAFIMKFIRWCAVFHGVVIPEPRGDNEHTI
ncbi:MAG: hypothetical protein ACE5D6_04620 [Candidatus Zixiibacteriota bacterium]